jgi:Mg2+ and Co2+ transporter CorA
MTILAKIIFEQTEKIFNAVREAQKKREEIASQLEHRHDCAVEVSSQPCDCPIKDFLQSVEKGKEEVQRMEEHLKSLTKSVKVFS